MENQSSGHITYSLLPTTHGQCTAAPFPKKNQRGTLSLNCSEGRQGGGGRWCTQANKNISRSPILSNQHIDGAEKGLLESFIKAGGWGQKKHIFVKVKN